MPEYIAQEDEYIAIGAVMFVYKLAYLIVKDDFAKLKSDGDMEDRYIDANVKYLLDHVGLMTLLRPLETSEIKSEEDLREEMYGGDKPKYDIEDIGLFDFEYVSIEKFKEKFYKDVVLEHVDEE